MIYFAGTGIQEFGTEGLAGKTQTTVLTIPCQAV